MLLLLPAGGAFPAAQAFIYPNILSPAGLPSLSSSACARMRPNIQFQLPARKEGFFL